MKINTIKTKNLKNIVYKNGYICINGMYLIKSELVQLDDTLLQDKINRNESFNYYADNTTRLKYFNDNIPPLEDIIPKNLSEYRPLENTGLYTEIAKTKAEVFYNPDTRLFSYFDADFTKVFKETKRELKLRQTENRYTSAVVVNNENEILFLIMPITNQRAYLEKFEKLL